MKAAVTRLYGPPENISIEEVTDPTPKNSEILISVKASSVNRTDDGFLRAKPFIVRFFSGFTSPNQPILGCEFAGEVVEIGSDVTLFRIGDRVFGFDDVGWGGHGEKKTMKEKGTVALIPKNTSYDEAAVSTEGAHYALSYIRAMQKRGVNKVLVHGATGAIGSAAVQLLKQAGTYVVATSTTKNIKLVSSLGADKVIDWEKQDLATIDETFDCVFDAVGKSSFRACKPLLNKRGIYIATELGPHNQNPFLALVSPIYKLFGAKYVLFPFPQNNKELIEFIAKRLEDETFKPVIDRTYTLNQIVDAYNYVETGQKTGNVILQIKLLNIPNKRTIKP